MMFGGGSPVKRSTEIIDLSAPSPVWSVGPNMSANRIQMNAVMLPNGKILLEGGSPVDDTPDAGARFADLYDAYSGTMSLGGGGESSFSRLYHSTSLLLPDATVASLGSNPVDRGKYLPRIEVYTPPYLYDANDKLITTGRPAIASVSASRLAYGETTTVTYTAALPIASAVLMRPGSTTHAFDMDQRLIGLCGPSPQPPCTGSGSLTLTMPPGGNVAPPGYYMLFLLDTNGVPSKAAWIELATVTDAPPESEITSPASDTTINQGGTVNFATASIAAKYAWVFPGGVPASSSAKNPGNVTFGTPGKYRASLTLIDASNNSDPSPPTRDITVLPTSPTYEVSVSPAARTVVPGGVATYTVTVTSRAGFSGLVSFGVSSESGIPAGVTSSFAPPTVLGSGTTTLTMSVGPAVLPYATTVTITAFAGTATQKTTATLIVSLPPPAPVSVGATDGTVSLAWPAAPGATGYRVARSLHARGPYQTVGCPAGTGYLDAGLTNGTTYYYTVSSAFTGGPNAGGASSEGPEVIGTPPCPTPTYLGVIGASKSGSGDVDWTWTSGGATAFDVVRGDLDVLRGSGGDFTAAIDALPQDQLACLANDTSAWFVDDLDGPPPVGSGIFVVLRPVTLACAAHGTFDSSHASQVIARDEAINLSARSCP
jgi:hypothetical protein